MGYSCTPRVLAVGHVAFGACSQLASPPLGHAHPLGQGGSVEERKLFLSHAYAEKDFLPQCLGFATNLLGSHGLPIVNASPAMSKFPLANGVHLGYITNMAAVEHGGYRVTYPMSEFLRALLESRTTLTTPDPLLRGLRQQPRLFLRTDRTTGTWSFCADQPKDVIRLCTGAMWPLGMNALPTRTEPRLATDAEVAEGFGFGSALELHDRDVLVFCGDQELAFFKEHNRRDLIQCHLHPVREWSRHSNSIKQKLPAYGPEYVEMIAQAERVYARTHSTISGNPAASIEEMRMLAYPFLLSVALRAMRGDFSA